MNIRYPIAAFVVAFFAGIMLMAPVAAATDTPVTKTYTDALKGEALMSVVMDAGNKSTAGTIAKAADQQWLKTFFPGFTVTRTDSLDPKFLSAWEAEQAVLYTGTYDSGPTNTLCTDCPTMLVVAQHGSTVIMTALIDTNGADFEQANVQDFVDYTGKIVSRKDHKADPPKGFVST